MTNMIDHAVLIVLEGDPVGKGRPRFTNQGGFVRVFTDAKTAAYEELIQCEVLNIIGGLGLVAKTRQIKRRTFIEAYRDFGGQPIFKGPVRVEMEIRHGIRASWTKAKKTGALAGTIAPTIKSDIDNICKIWFDAFNHCMWADDTQVVEVHAKKTFSEEPCVLVRVIPLDLQNA